MTAFSLMAYILWIYLAASLFRLLFRRVFSERFPEEHVQRATHGLCASCLAVAVFFFMPSGSLPTFFSVPHGGGWAIACLAASFACASGRKAVLISLLPVVFIAAMAFYFVYQAGFPGSFASLGSFVAVPVFGAVSFSALCGFLLLAVGFLWAAGSWVACHVQELSSATVLRIFAVSALFVIIFIPWNSAPYSCWPDALVAGVDFLLFWTKIFFTAFCLVFFPTRFSTLWRFSALLCAVGAFLLFLALW